MSEFVEVLDKDKAAVSHLQQAAEAIVKRLQSTRKEDPKLVEQLLGVVKELRQMDPTTLEQRLLVLEKQIKDLHTRINFCEGVVGVKRPKTTPVAGGEAAPLFQPG